MFALGGPDAIALGARQPADSLATVAVPAIAISAAAAPSRLDYYQAPPPEPTMLAFGRPAPGAGESAGGSAGTGLVTFSPVLSVTQGFDSANDPLGRSGFGSNSTVVAPSFSAPIRIGPVHVTGRVDGATAQDPSLALRDDAYGAGANFTLPAGKRNVNVDLSGGVEHLTRDDAQPLAASSAGGGATWQVPANGDAAIVVPAYADVTKHTMGAAVAVPVTQRVLFDMQYNNQRLYGRVWRARTGESRRSGRHLRRGFHGSDTAYDRRVVHFRASISLPR